MRANPIEIQRSMTGTDTNIRHLTDTHNSMSENVVAEVNDAFLVQFLTAPEAPTIKANALEEPLIYGLPQTVQDFIIDVCIKKQVPIEFVLSPLLVIAGTMAGRNAVLDGRGYEKLALFLVYGYRRCRSEQEFSASSDHRTSRPSQRRRYSEE